MDIDELIDIVESCYPHNKQEKLVQILWKNTHCISKDELEFLKPLLDQGILEIQTNKFIEYRLEKFFENSKIQSLTDKKNFIFKHLPENIKLPGGKNISYDNLIPIVEKEYYEIFENILKDYITVDYTPHVEKIGNTLNLYLHRQFKGASVKFDSATNTYVKKEDEAARILKERGKKLDNNPLNKTYISSNKKKSKLVAILLCLFFGALGVHRFYAGKTTSAVIMLILCLFTMGIVPLIWSLIDLILIITGNFGLNED